MEEMTNEQTKQIIKKLKVEKLTTPDETQKIVGRRADLIVKVNKNCNPQELMMHIYASLPFRIKRKKWTSKWLDIYCWDLEPEDPVETKKPSKK